MPHVEPRARAPQVGAESGEAATPALSVVVLTGPSRERGERLLAALAAQDITEPMEVVLVDLAGGGETPAVSPGRLLFERVEAPAGSTWGAARATGLRASHAALVAFLEDHCVPEPGWARAVVAAFEHDCAAVGYSFVNGSPDRLLYRTIVTAEYGQWLHPAIGGPVGLLPNNNVAYRRADLLTLGGGLDELLEVDFNVHQRLLAIGRSLWLAADAVAAHQSSARLGDLFVGHFAFSRLLAGRRAEVERWGLVRRAVHGLAAPAVVPLLRLVRVWRATGGAVRRRLLASLPLTWALYCWAALGESAGCLLGRGRASISLATMELEWPRAVRPGPR